MRDIVTQVRTKIMKDLGTTTYTNDYLDKCQIYYDIHNWCLNSLEVEDFKAIPDFDINKHNKGVREFCTALISANTLKLQIHNINKANKVVVNSPLTRKFEHIQAPIYAFSPNITKVIGYTIANNPNLKITELRSEYLKPPSMKMTMENMKMV